MNTSSEQFRRECEARHIMMFPKDRRKAYYQGVKEKRGEAAEKELIAEVKRQYKLRDLEQEIEA